MDESATTPPVHATGCTEYDEDGPSRCASGCPIAMTARAEAFLADGTGSTPGQRQAAHYILHGTWPTPPTSEEK